MNEYTYEKQCKPSTLTTEIENSVVMVTPIHTIISDSMGTYITFLAELSEDEVTELDSIVFDHDITYTPEDTKDKVEISDYKSPDGRPLLYTTPRPNGFYTCFTGEGDDIVNSTIGGGNKMLFHLLSLDTSKIIDLTFFEDIYVKDGYMIVLNAPFGATLSVDIVHPATQGVLLTFAKNIPIYGSGWFPMDSEDAGLVSAGLIIRLTINNSSGMNSEEPPAEFRVAGRLELYRPLPT